MDLDHWKVTREWMQEVMETQFPDDEDEFQNALQNGVVICELVNIIKPNSIKRINEGPVFLERENISSFIAFARSIGCAEMDLFCISDLYELKNFKKVCICILSVGRHSAKLDCFKGPYYIGGKITNSREGSKEKVVIISGTEDSICPTCNKKVMFTERLNALGSVYHRACFKCVNCGNLIGGGDYCDRNNKPLCTKCYDHLYSTRPNKAEYVEQSGYSREESIRCSRSSNANSDALQDLFKRNQDKCAKCGKTVYPVEMIVFGGACYHKLCFSCTSCERSIPLGEQYERDDKPYCKACYSKLSAFKGEKA